MILQPLQLFLRFNRLVELPEEIGALKSLEILRCGEAFPAGVM